MNSTQFNTYLYLYQGSYPSGTIINQDDNGGATNSKIPATSGFLTLPATGTYTILASSPTSGTTGNYSVSIRTTCSYFLNPTFASVPSTGSKGSVSVSTVSGCAWTAASNASWLRLTGATSGTVTYAVDANTGARRTGTISIGGQAVTVSQAAPEQTTSLDKHFDYDGAGKFDPAVFQTSNAAFYIQRSQSGFTAAAFGTSGDQQIEDSFVR